MTMSNITRSMDFSFDQFHYHMEEQQKRLRLFNDNSAPFLPVIQRPGGEHFSTMSHTKEDSLISQLRMLDDSTKLLSDFGFNYLEPWHGTGVYAAAFGCEVIWYKHTAPQTNYAYNTIEEARGVLYPDIKKCDIMQMVIETIGYFREQTGGAIPMCLTDTQSPNDTASLILDTCEFLAGVIEEPETTDRLLNLVTRLIIEFSDIQRDVIGEDNVSEAGHMMISDTSFKGISISDDNMSFLSPAVYASSAMPYNSILSSHFSGIAIHSCGIVTHNLPHMLSIEGLKWVDLAVGYESDPNPNEAEDILKFFSDKDITLKVRLGPNEVERVFPLLTPRVKLIVELATNGTIDERNRQYCAAKDKLLLNYK